jgi:hypothetical protein
MTILVGVGLIKPLGKPAPNAIRFFARPDLDELANDAKWLDRACAALGRHWRVRNERLTGKKPDDSRMCSGNENANIVTVVRLLPLAGLWFLLCFCLQLHEILQKAGRIAHDRSRIRDVEPQRRCIKLLRQRIVAKEDIAVRQGDSRMLSVVNIVRFEFLAR